MKIALLPDIHFGVNNDSIPYLENTRRFLQEVFFPKIDEHNVNIVISLGDIMHRRKYVNYLTAMYCETYLFKPIRDRSQSRNLRFEWIIGNHDLFFREMLDVSCADILRNPGYTVKEAVTRTYVEKIGERKDGSPIWKASPKFCLVPWICKQNFEQVFKHIEETDAKVCIGHLDLAEFEANKGTWKAEGFDRKYFKKFDVVYTGHYHHPSIQDNINYVGAANQQTWHDYDDPRGFHILDTDTMQLEFFRNPFDLYHKTWYDDGPDGFCRRPIELIKKETNWDEFAGKVVKLIVTAKNDPNKFEWYVDEIEKQQPIEVLVVDDHLNFQLQDDEEIISEAKETIDIIREFVKQAEGTVNTEKLDSLMIDLYTKAQEGNPDE